MICQVCGGQSAAKQWMCWNCQRVGVIRIPARPVNVADTTIMEDLRCGPVESHGIIDVDWEAFLQMVHRGSLPVQAYYDIGRALREPVQDVVDWLAWKRKWGAFLPDA